MITGRHLPRRTVLRGLGATVALPFLDAMAPAFAAPARSESAPMRLAFAYVPNGVIMEDWTPSSEGAEFELKPILAPLAEFRRHMLILSGLTHNNGRALGDGPGDHARAAASYLTGVHPKKTAGADIRNGISVDQVAARSVGAQTRFASLELGCEDGRQAGNCDSGYACAYSNNISWRSETSPMPPEINPRLVFERLFGADAGSDPAERLQRRRLRKSILDFVAEDTQKLQRELGPTDRRKLDEYLYAVRDIEKRIEAAESDAARVEPAMARPLGVPVEYANHVRLMFDLLAVAFQADLTRVATFMLAREGSNRTYPEVGVNEAHHGLTHHRNDREKIRKISRINRFHIEQFAAFLGRLSSTADGNGTLLEHSIIVYGSGIADGNRHTHHDLPVLVAGGGSALKTGRHIRYPSETPMTNLYLSLLDRVGVQVEALGDSTGKLEGLSDL